MNKLLKVNNHRPWTWLYNTCKIKIYSNIIIYYTKWQTINIFNTKYNYLELKYYVQSML